MLFRSDGLTEAMNERHDEYGDQRIRDILKTTENFPAREIQHSIIQSVEAFRGTAEQNDDLTLVAVKIR